MTKIIYTIGHSTHDINHFLELIKNFNINCIIDVRSVPASSYTPQYNKEPLSNFLKDNGITYMHFPAEFGAKHVEPELLDKEGNVNFEKVRKSNKFQNGVKRILQGINKGYAIALMCSESDPFNCHRFSMISVALEKEGFNVQHILKDKTIMTNAQLERQLLKKYDNKIPKDDLFTDVTMDEQLRVAYRLRNKEIAFSPYETKLEGKYD